MLNGSDAASSTSGGEPLNSLNVSELPIEEEEATTNASSEALPTNASTAASEGDKEDDAAAKPTNPGAVIGEEPEPATDEPETSRGGDKEESSEDREKG